MLLNFLYCAIGGHSVLHRSRALPADVTPNSSRPTCPSIAHLPCLQHLCHADPVPTISWPAKLTPLTKENDSSAKKPDTVHTTLLAYIQPPFFFSLDIFQLLHRTTLDCYCLFVACAIYSILSWTPCKSLFGLVRCFALSVYLSRAGSHDSPCIRLLSFRFVILASCATKTSCGGHTLLHWFLSIPSLLWLAFSLQKLLSINNFVPDCCLSYAISTIREALRRSLTII